ncbi:GntR family transcriptional regulator [Streptomyces armeniacus]|uniref:GntR family transcriptional regulator n=1 Tax=Streptomyces armeniacus TaxID=83291 RepID=A0A345XJP8_9ACTN|nr:GntR family transcriptional regulator [Streptomyces armeniacus]AXK31864.1 GntR family transcriptional regulator [Streptomyces armeniacus]
MTVASDSRVADRVHHELREQIIAGDFPAGARLSVPALAERLGVSRSPVREAIVRLVHERLAREEPRRGAVVADVSHKALIAIYEVREVLEGLATRLAVENAGQRLIRTLVDVLREHEHAVSAVDLATASEADMTFHRLIREAADNAEVVRMLDDVQTQVRLAMRTTQVTGGPKLAVADHRAILTAMEAGDPAAAENAARAHIARLRTVLAEQAEGPR